MWGFKKFSGLSKLITSTIRKIPPATPSTKNNIRSYSALSDSNLNKFKIVGFNVFNYEFQPVLNIRRHMFTMMSPKKIISTYDFDFTSEWALKLKVRLSEITSKFIDKTFDPEEFECSARVAVPLISKLIAESRFDELENLTTPECFAKVKENMDSWESVDRSDLVISESDHFYVKSAMCEAVTNPDQNKKGIEALLFFHVIKGIKEEVWNLKMSSSCMEEYHEKMDSFMVANKSTLYVGHFKFIKWFSDNESNDWIVSGVNIFRVDYG